MCCYCIAQVVSCANELFNSDDDDEQTKIDSDEFFDCFGLDRHLPEELSSLCKEFYSHYRRRYHPSFLFHKRPVAI